MTTVLEAFLKTKPANIDNSIRDLKLHILNDGIPCSPDGSSPLRCIIWSILLDVDPMSTDDYLELVYRGPSAAYQKIRNDTFRTLASDPIFKNKVSEASLIRVLNSYAWRYMDGHLAAETTDRDTEAETIPYVQGMNVLAAPFLYACNSEAQAYAMYSVWLDREVPQYVKPSLEGVHKGVRLVDRCLKRLDLKLYNFLLLKGLSAELYAFPSVMTLSACTPPLPEVLCLWDFLIAYGPHMNILCIIAQLIMMREQLMTSASPMSLLRKFPGLKGARAKQLAISFIPGLGADLYGLLARHCWDESLKREMI